MQQTTIGTNSAILPETFSGNAIPTRSESDWENVIKLAFLQPQISGKHPHVKTFQRQVEFPDQNSGFESLLPDGAAILRDFRGRSSDLALVESGDCWVLFRRTQDSVHLVISGKSVAEIEVVAQQIGALLPGCKTQTADPRVVPIRVWQQDIRGASSTSRRLDVPLWSDIEQNYPAAVRSKIADLMKIERPVGHGRLILWHGAPGTGKTTAIRALMAAWSHWCEPHYVIDPEQAFANPSYLMDLITTKVRNPIRSAPHGEGEDGEPERKWRLIIAEDSDEFLRADARRAAGAALGRLLNLSDGILGQGSNTLILLTTNEDMRELHPALIRPGRALAKTEFTPFAAAEANEWFGGAASISSPATLAELFEKRGSIKRVTDQPKRQRIGFAAAV